MKSLSHSEVKILLKDILNGYNRIKHRSFGEIFVKHYTAYDNAMIDDYKDVFYKKAKESGLPSDSEKLEEIIQNGDWTKDKESLIPEYRRSIANLQDTKSKLLLENQKRGIQDRINKQREELEKLETERHSLLGYTAERYSSKKANEYFIFESLRKDKSLKERFFNEEDFDDLDNFTLGELIGLYNEVSEIFSEVNLRRISYSSGFLNLYYMSPESAYEFYGKPILELTFYQIELFSNAKIFKNLVSSAKYPPSTEAYQDPDLLISWVNDARSSSQDGTVNNSPSPKGNSSNKEDVGGGGSYVGATKNDLKKLAKDGDNVINLSTEARKMGGNLNMQDIMKLHGIKV